jgi:hypothetical protein
VPRGGEDAHVQAYLRDDHLGGVPADAGDLIQAGGRGQHRRAGRQARARAGDAIGAAGAAAKIVLAGGRRWRIRCRCPVRSWSGWWPRR